MTSKLGALARLRRAKEAIGADRIALLTACVVHDQSWRALGRELKADATTAKLLVVEAVQALALHHEGRAVPSPPIQRLRIQPRSW
jgi:hypothetical protein